MRPQAKKILRRDVRRYLPLRARRQNKSHGGRSLVVAGSDRYAGAAILSARAAARSGAGYVTVAMPDGKALRKSILKNPDFLLRPFDAALVRSVEKDGYTAIAIGPGLGTKPAVRKLAWSLIQRLAKKSELGFLPVVLDADALNAVSQFRVNSDKPFPKSWIMTPHEGELARLLKVSVEDIQADRLGHVRKAQRQFGCIVILKGEKTLVANGQSVWVNTTGNSALAKAGTGDVLTGILVGFLSQNVEPVEAAKLSVFLHGLIADRWVKSGRDHLSLMASDLIELLPKELLRLRRA